MRNNLEIKNVVPDCGDKTRSHLYRQVLGTLASGLTSLCSGLTFGISAVMLPQLRKDESLKYDPTYDSWIASSATLAMVFGSVASGPFLDNFGRKPAHIFLGIPYIIGWTCIACANSTDLILVGRILTGFSAGANKAVTLVYIGEIANPKFRSSALFVPTLASNIGVTFSHIIGDILPWKISAIVCLVPIILSCIIFMFLKESPLWLIAKGRTEEGIETFRWFRGTDEASEEELQVVLKRQTEKPKISVRETFNAVCTLSFILPMLLLMVLMLDLQFSGVNVIIFYSEDIYQRVFSGKVDVLHMMIAMDSLRGVTVIALCVFGKNIPKKVAIVICSFGLSVSVLGLVTCIMIKFNGVWLSILFMVMFMAFSTGILTIGWTFTPELLPNNARGFGAGLILTVSYIMLSFLVKITPDFMNTYGEAALFGVFGISTFVSGFILCLFLPETSGKTLQSIEDSYNRKLPTTNSITEIK